MSLCNVPLTLGIFDSASLAGTRIVLRQVSPESEAIYDFIISLHLRSGGNWTSLQQKANLTDEELGQFLNYGAQFLANSGNYKGFGDTKFIPRLPADRLKALATAVPEALELYQKIEKDLYAGDSKERLHLGYPDEGHVSNYYPDSPSITKDEITEISGFLEDKRILPENTRLRKTARGDFELLVASASENPNETQRDTKETQWTLSGKLKGKSLTVVYGDYTHELQKVADALENASKHAGNETQRSMLQEYAKSFRSGSLLAFKNSQRYWIKDKSPSVECNIGFIETYRDPHGVRAEWEGFVAMVNKERTEAFTELVKAAPGIIPRLPWDREFEKDKFLSPDFTSLEVLTFAGSGIPGEFCQR